MATAVNLQRDAGLMLSNLQILSQFVTSLHRMSSEMITLGMGLRRRSRPCLQHQGHPGRGGSRIFSQGGSGGTKCQRDAAGVWGDGKKGGLGVLPQENLESEVL